MPIEFQHRRPSNESGTVSRERALHILGVTEAELDALIREGLIPPPIMRTNLSNIANRRQRFFMAELSAYLDSRRNA